MAVSFETPEYTANSDALGTLQLLEAIRILGLRARFYQASTAEMYGKVVEIPQRETTPFYPRSPYGAAKVYAYWITVNYREAYGMFACNGILFNHESPLRGETFVTRKITRGLARIAVGLDQCVYLGNMDARRDWGHARDYVEAQWLMLQQEVPEDVVIATGEQYSVREFAAAACLNMNIGWRGSGLEEVGGRHPQRKDGCPGRSALLSPHGGRDPARRPVQGKMGAGLVGTHQLRRPCERDDRGGSRTRLARCSGGARRLPDSPPC